MDDSTVDADVHERVVALQRLEEAVKRRRTRKLSFL
jgi:hypothetical protein